VSLNCQRWICGECQGSPRVFGRSAASCIYSPINSPGEDLDLRALVRILVVTNILDRSHVNAK
jgi:hypothetical protein